MKFSTLPPKGTFDVTPVEMELRSWMQDTIQNTYKEHGFTQIETPCIENLDLLTNSEGGENLQMLFKILKRGDKFSPEDIDENTTENDLCDLGLRFDLTLPLSRFYANNRNDLINPFKAFQMGYVWRAEKPQKGRFRQFTQCDIDILGDDSVYAEIDLILTVTKALRRLGFDDCIVKVNDRRLLREMVERSGLPRDDFDTLCITLDKADKIGKDGVVQELLDKGFEEASARNLLDILQTIDDEGLEAFDSEEAKDLQRLIDNVKDYYPIEFSPTLVRGMGYYTGPIFEIESRDFKSAIAGGGRYDDLLSKFQKDSLPAVGISIGFERIFAILQEKGFVIPEQPKKRALVFTAEEDLEKTVAFAEALRDRGQMISMVRAFTKLGKKVKQLENAGYDDVLVIREDTVLDDLLH